MLPALLIGVVLSTPVVSCAAGRPAAHDGPAYTFADHAARGDVDISAVLVVPDPVPDRGWVRIVFGYLHEYASLFVYFVGDTVSLGKIGNGSLTLLRRQAPCPELRIPGEHTVVIKRRDWSIRVMVDGRLAAAAHEAFWPGERVAWIGEGLEVADLVCQEVGELVFNDDFSRPPGETSPWQPVRGTWETVLPESRSKATDAVHSANPFSYRATGDAPLCLLSEVEYPAATYWSDYEVSAAVKAMDGSPGVLFGCLNPENYYLVRATLPPHSQGAGTVSLVRVLHGQETTLATAPAALRPGTWYRLGARFCDGVLEALLDGQVLCRAEDTSLCHGRVGLAASGSTRAFFDDIALRRWATAHEDFSTDGSTCFDSIGGRWEVRQGWLSGAATPQARFATCLMGGQGWRDYAVAAQIRPGSARAVGLYFNCTGPDDYLLFRWGPDPVTPGEDVQQLWKVAGGQAGLLAARPAPLPRGRTVRVSVVADRGLVKAAVEGTGELEAGDVTPGGGLVPARPGGGRIGFLVEGTPGQDAAFDDLRVTFCDPPQMPVSIADQFEREDSMANWARPAASWVALADGLHAYTLPVWGDFILRITLRSLEPSASEWGLGLRVAPDTESLATRPAAITVQGRAGLRGLQCTVGATTWQGTSADAQPLLELERRGRVLIARLDGCPLAWGQIADGSLAPAVGLTLTGAGPSLNDVLLTSPNIFDDTFSDAPVHWTPVAGTWDISDRWTCSPAWAWYCGREAPRPLTWHKRPVAGDMVAEFWAAVMHEGGYPHPSDLNGVICGDGQSLDSGYAFVFAGDNNTVSKLLRNGQVVASTPEVRFFDTSSNEGFHRHWFHCRLEKIGQRLTFTVDGKKAIEWTDPQVLEAGRFGIWTDQGNGILIARARLAFQR